MKNRFFCGFAAFLSLVACTRMQETNVPEANMTLIAKTESSAASRTVVVDETHVYWEPWDEIAVFSGTKRGVFYTQISEPTDTAPFIGQLDDGSDGVGMDLWALYPNSWDASFEDESITTVLPAWQEAREGSFGQGMNLSIAHSTTGTLQFYNVGGGVRFSVQDDGIREVIFQGLDGEILAGKVRLGFRDGLPAVLDVREGRRSISLLAPYGGTFKKGQWYYFVAIPGALEKGFEMHFFKEGGHGSRVFEKSVTVKRSIYGNLTNIDADVTYSPFSNGIIGFADDQVRSILASHFDLDRNGRMTLIEAAVVRSFQFSQAETRADDGKESIFAGTGITSFDEMVYFTGLPCIEDGAFAGCTELTSITIPANVTSIGDNAFNGCTGFQSITIMAPTPPEIGKDAFANTGDCPISVPEDAVDDYVSEWNEYAPRIRADELSYPVPEAVDLGLPSGVKWASFNLGASKPEEYGYYYAWGETEPKSIYTEYTYKWFTSDDSSEGFTKYCSDPEEGFNGFRDDKMILDPEDDAAHVHLGDDWRLPTAGEWSELVRECSFDWISVNGISCRRVTGPNGNSIILPPGGTRYSAGVEDVGSVGGFWSSSAYVDAWYSWGFGYDDEDEYYFSPYGDREMGVSIRPVLGRAPILPESISLDKTTLDLSLGETATLSVFYQPENVTHKVVFWESSNKSVVTVSETGEVRGLKTGEAIIGAITIDGNKFATCTVRVSVPDPVDLGLPSGIKWGSFNLGTSRPYGDYYAWGETDFYYEAGDAQSDSPRWKRAWNQYYFRDVDYGDGGYCWNSYRFSNMVYDDDGNAHQSGLNKYTYYYSVFEGREYYDGDGKFVLEPEDDVAHLQLGGDWRIPSRAEMQELIDVCTWEWTMQDGVSGQKVTGPNGNSIFLPAAGYRSGLNLSTFDTAGRYWTSSRYQYENQAMLLFFSPDAHYVARSYRYLGYAIRPVQGNPPVPVEGVSLDQTEIELVVGETITLNAAVSPANATFTDVSWYYDYFSSSDPVDLISNHNQATLLAKAPGFAAITILTQDGGMIANCKVTVREAVDLLVDDLVGSYTCSTSSSRASEQPWIIEIRRDRSDNHKVWFWYLYAYQTNSGADRLFYGTVDETQGTITIPYGQQSEYLYNGETPITLYWIDADGSDGKTGSNTATIRKDDSGKVVGIDFDENYGFGGLIEEVQWVGYAFPRITAVKNGVSSSASNAPRRQFPSFGPPELD